MLRRDRQTGLTGLSWLAVTVIAVVFVIFVVKIGPVYLESFTVKSILNQVADESRAEGLGKSQIHERLSKKILINTVKGMTMKDVLVSGTQGNFTIDANYEVRKRLFFNLDVVVVFDNMVVTLQTS